MSDPAKPAADAAESTPSMLRISIVLFALCIGLLLSSLETSIVATALVSVSSELGDYSQAHWIVVSYLLTYTGMMIPYARLSDVYGKKPAVLVAVGTFGVFSLGCGLARDMPTLIALRALQGAGASGIYAMAFAIAPTILPLRYFGASSAAIGAVYAASSVLGPVLGGAIAGSGAWRWIFLLNVPPCAAIFLAILLAYPPQAPAHDASPRQIDVVGLALFLGSSVLLVFALEQGGDATYGWASAPIVGTLVASIGCLLCLALWLCWLLPRLNAGSRSPILPAFPASLLRSRPLVFSFVAGFLSGAPFTATLILVPQRLQLVHSLSPLAAGLRTLPLLLSSAVGSGLGGACARVRHGAWSALVGGAALVVLGLGLERTVAADATPGTVPAPEYAFLAILGLGFGTGLSSLVVLARLMVGDQDSSVLLAALTQIRVLGGCVGLAAANAVVQGRTWAGLASILGDEGLQSVMRDAQSLAALPQAVQQQARGVFAGAFRDALLVMLAFAGAAVLACLPVWNKDAKTLKEFDGGVNTPKQNHEAKPDGSEHEETSEKAESKEHK